MDTTQSCTGHRLAPPPLLRRRCADRRRHPTRHGRLGVDRTGGAKGACHQARDRRGVRNAEADRRRSPECRFMSSSAPKMAPRSFSCTGWPYDIHSFGGSGALAGLGRLSGHRSVSARLWHHAVPFERGDPQRPAVGACRRCRRASGQPQDREGDPRRLRLGARARRTSWRHSGRSGVRPWFPSAAI